MITLETFLTAHGLLPTRSSTKLVRHADARFVIEDLKQEGILEEYQKFQGKPIFDRCSHIISFVGEDGSRSRFLGVYKVGLRRRADQGPTEYQSAPWAMNAKYWYPMTRLERYDELADRLIVDWGKGARSWHQWYSDRAILEIRAQGRLLPPFKDYLEINLTYPQLQHLVDHREAHRDWYSALTAVGGVYLIVSKDGVQYVGSATGENGLWQRWSEYAKTGHGNNRELRRLCSDRSHHPFAFTFSILETLSKSTAKDVALKKEAFFKRKPGSRAHGLNVN